MRTQAIANKTATVILALCAAVSGIFAAASTIVIPLLIVNAVHSKQSKLIVVADSAIHIIVTMVLGYITYLFITALNKRL